MTSTREKLAACMHAEGYYVSVDDDSVLDALEAIVEEARNEAIEECARFVERGSFLHDKSPAAMFGKQCAAGIRSALKVSK